MNRPIIAYASGTEASIPAQHVGIDAHARARRSSVVQRHADVLADPSSILQRSGLHRAIAAAIEQRGDLCIATIAVLGSSTAVGQTLALLARANVQLVTLDGSRPEASSAAVAAVVADADALREKIRRVRGAGLIQPTLAPPPLVARVASEVNSEIAGRRSAREHELPVPAAPRVLPVAPREGSAANPHRIEEPKA